VRDQLLGNVPDQIDRIAKPIPLSARIDRGVDSDRLAADVAQRAARVAEVDRGVGLDEVLEVGVPPKMLRFERPCALMMPTVTEPRSTPSGFPIAIAQSRRGSGPNLQAEATAGSSRRS